MLFKNVKNYLVTLAFTTLATFTFATGLATGAVRAGLATFTLTSLAAVRKHEVQTLIFIPSMFFVCKLMFCLFKVLIFE